MMKDDAQKHEKPQENRDSPQTTCSKTSPTAKKDGRQDNGDATLPDLTHAPNLLETLTISQFAALRGVSLGSLHYYENMGLLKPAWVDPRTKYRYYTPDQLTTLDIILMCTSLGLPLKSLTTFITDGELDEAKLLEIGKGKLEETIAVLRGRLRSTQTVLDALENEASYRDVVGDCDRHLGRRFFVESQPTADRDAFLKMRSRRQTIDLFHQIEEKEMVPTFPFQLLGRRVNGQVLLSWCLMVLNPLGRDFPKEGDDVREAEAALDGMVLDDIIADGQPVHLTMIEAGNYHCVRSYLEPGVRPIDQFLSAMPTEDCSAVLLLHGIHDPQKRSVPFGEFQYIGTGLSWPATD